LYPIYGGPNHLESFEESADVPEDPRIHKAQLQLNNIKEITRDNIQQSLKQGEQLENSMILAENLEIAGGQFRRDATSLKSRFCRKKWILTIVLILIVIGILALIIAFASKS